MNERVCSMCGKELDEFDLQENFSFKRYIGYGSRFDMHFLDVRLCCSCMDKIFDTILPMFKINPLSEYEIVSDGDKLIGRRKDDKNGK